MWFSERSVKTTEYSNRPSGSMAGTRLDTGNTPRAGSGSPARPAIDETLSQIGMIASSYSVAGQVEEEVGGLALDIAQADDHVIIDLAEVIHDRLAVVDQCSG